MFFDFPAVLLKLIETLNETQINNVQMRDRHLQGKLKD